MSETLQNRNTTLPKAQNLLTIYTERIESLVSLGEHSSLAQLAEEAMSFIRAVTYNIKQRLFTTVSNRTQASVVATCQEMYKHRVSQMAGLNPHNLVHENPRFGEDEVES